MRAMDKPTEPTAEQKQAWDAMFDPEPLVPELEACIETSAGGWKMLRHPLVYSVPYTSAMNKIHNQFYKHKVERLKQAIAEKDWFTATWLHERPHRWDALRRLAPQ